MQRAVKEQLLPPGARVLIPKEVAAGALEARRISEGQPPTMHCAYKAVHGKPWSLHLRPR